MAESNTDSRVDGLSRQLNELGQRIGKLERDVAATAQAVYEAARFLGGKLDEVRSSVVEGGKQVTDRVDTTNERMNLAIVGVAATTAAVVEHRMATVRNIERAHELIAKQTSAVVQMEVLRAFNEARALKSKVGAFTDEVDERFLKAIEGLFINRLLYDKHFQAIYDEYDTKIRTIGEHIFAIWENDLRPAEDAAKVPHSSYQELAVEVDLERLARRSAQLDQDLDVVYDAALGPRLDLDRAFERALSSTYSASTPAEPGLRASAAAVYLAGARGSKQFVCDMVALPADDAKIEVQIQPAGNLGAFSERARNGDHAERIGKVASRRAMTDAEAAEFRNAIGRLASRGLVPRALLPGLEAYLAKVPLQILADQEVTA